MIELFRNLFSPPRHMILLVAAAWFGLSFAEKRAERHGIQKDDLNNVIFYGLPFGNTPEFWLNAQRAVDLWDTAESIKKDVSRIKPLNAA